uniref:AlNc14C1036G12733 protein n=1 Tax=Albugo laibachii Nc14 TaxID=890382 RepID=F0X2G0_9STRA|nr:AlNc14C1036G12733 [Albugo laibachii Nc14]|eukprot:CCA28055.1 AlNc14C1036G12733 [Albugo laibachii Nc14]
MESYDWSHFQSNLLCEKTKTFEMHSESKIENDCFTKANIKHKFYLPFCFVECSFRHSDNNGEKLEECKYTSILFCTPPNVETVYMETNVNTAKVRTIIWSNRGS